MKQFVEDWSLWEGSMLKQVESERRKRELSWTDHISPSPCAAQKRGGRGVKKEGVKWSMVRREDGGKVSF